MLFKPMMLTRHNIIVFCLCFIGIVALEISRFDFYIQDFFYNRTTHTWFVDGSDPFLKMIFYNGPKYIIVCFGVILLGCFLCRWKSHRQRTVSDKKMVVVLLSIIFIPTIIALFKELTYVHCPSRLHLYGGESDFRYFFDLISRFDSLDRGKCFPAGHASGGFALMSLYIFGRTPAMQWVWMLMGFLVGWIMAFYQMAKGAHFLSHSCMTMLLSWGMIAGFSRLVFLKDSHDL